MADDTDPAMLALAQALATVLAPAAAPAAPAAPAAEAAPAAPAAALVPAPVAAAPAGDGKPQPPPGRAPVANLDEFEALPQPERLARMAEADWLLLAEGGQ